MEEFALCIEYILLNRDRLTVPGLGTFVVKQLGAKYDLKEELFLPPIRIVQYSEQTARGEETFFTSAIRQIYNISALEAQSKLDVWIADFFQSIEDSGSVDLGCIGTFTGNADGHLLFTSSESGIASPTFYALDTFHIKRLTPCEGKKKTEKVITNTGNTLVIRLPHRIMRYVAAVSAAVLVMFGLSAPVDESVNTRPAQQQSTVLSPAKISDAVASFSKENAKETKMAEQKAPKEGTETDEATAEANETISEAPAQTVAEDVVDETDAPTEITVTDNAAPTEEPVKECYYIVMASNVSNKNAENYVEVLKQRGFDSARVLKGKFNRVVVGEYSTAEKAYAAANAIKQKDKEYRNAWIYKQGD